VHEDSEERWCDSSIEPNTSMKPRTIETVVLVALVGIVGSFIGSAMVCYSDWVSGGLKGAAFYLRLFLFLSLPYLVTIILCSYVSRRQDRRREPTDRTKRD